MENSETVTIILSVVAIVLFIVVVIQVFLLRAEIDKQAKDVYRKADEARSTVQQAVDDSAKLQVYPLVIDTVMTRDISPSIKYFDGIAPMLVPRQFNVPYLCNSKIQSLQVDAYQVGILVAHMNNGAHRLAQDVASGRVQYVYLQKKPFLVAPLDDGVIERVKQFTDIASFRNMDQRAVFALYAVQSASNIVTTPAAGCTLAVTSPFLNTGAPAAMTGTKGIDLVTELSLQRDQEPMHALGYKL